MTDRERHYLAVLERLVNSALWLGIARADRDGDEWLPAFNEHVTAIRDAQAVIAQARKEQE